MAWFPFVMAAVGRQHSKAKEQQAAQTGMETGGGLFTGIMAAASMGAAAAGSAASGATAAGSTTGSAASAAGPAGIDALGNASVGVPDASEWIGDGQPGPTPAATGTNGAAVTGAEGSAFGGLTDMPSLGFGGGHKGRRGNMLKNTKRSLGMIGPEP